MATDPRPRLTVYTVLIGSKEPLNDPLCQLPTGAGSDLDLDFVCITDNRALQSDVWRFAFLDSDHLPPEKLSRRPKALPHEYFPDSEFSLYIDNTVTFRRLPQASDLAAGSDDAQTGLFRAYRHPDRQRLQEEADAVALMGYDDIGTICGQLDFYASRVALDRIAPLTTGTVLLRAHHHPTLRRFGVLWWESLLAFSKRDQLSLDFALQRSGARIAYFAGSLHDNDFTRRNDATGTPRVHASFDAKRYAWLHRGDPEARRDPKAHYLAHGAGRGGPHYPRRLPLLEYVCHKQGSSLGQQVSPRRGMADALEALLAPHRRAGCRYLLVRVQAPQAPRGFDSDELAAASLAIQLYMGRDSVGTMMDLSAADLAAADKVYAARQEPFELLVLLGLGGEQLVAASQKLVRLLAPGRGALVAALTSTAPLPEVVRAAQLCEDVLGQTLRVALNGSRHDEVDGMLDNTVVGLSC